MNQGTANVCLDDRKLKRILQEPGESRIDLHLEAKAVAVTLTLVPKARFENLEFTLERDVEPRTLAMARGRTLQRHRR